MRELTRSSFLILGFFVPLSLLAILRRDDHPAGGTSPTASAGPGPGTGTGTGTPTVPPSPSRAAGGPPVPVGGPGGVVWSKPVFRDEFSGHELDTATWHPGWFGDGSLSGPVSTSGHETAAYATDHLRVARGKLSFRVGPNTTGRSVDGTTYPNLGAQITSDPLQGANPGYLSPGYDYYLECSSRMPAAAPGARVFPQPAFWQNSHHWPAGFEIDVVEGFGSNMSQWRVHYPTSVGASTQFEPAPGGVIAVPGSTTGFHTYGALVEGPRQGLANGRFTFYYDGEQAGWLIPGVPVPDTGRYLVLGVSTGGKGGLPGDVYLIVDYVRVWTYTGTPQLSSTSSSTILPNPSAS